MSNTGFVTNPTSIGIPHIKYKYLGLTFSYFGNNAHCIVLMVFTTATVKPEVIYLAVAEKKLTYLVNK